MQYGIIGVWHLILSLENMIGVFYACIEANIWIY